MSGEQRCGVERRRRGLPPLQFLIKGGRRRTVRRAEDGQGIVLLDRYSPKLFATIMGILCLSIMDAVLTLYLIENGANEVNPVMGFFLRKGPFIFAIAKYALTSLAVIIFVVLANSVVPRSQLRTYKLLDYTLLAFGGVIVWQLALIWLRHGG